jgi:hypothetical protein
VYPRRKYPLIESGLGVSASLLDSFIEIQGEEADVCRAQVD